MNCIWVLLLLFCCNGNRCGMMNCGNMCDNDCDDNRGIRGDRDNCDDRRSCDGNCDDRRNRNDRDNCDDRCDCDDRRNRDDRDNCDDRRSRNDRKDGDDWRRRDERRNEREDCGCDNNASMRTERIVPPDFRSFGRGDNYDRRNDSRCETCGCEG